ncbi:MAG: amidase family protein [Deltaproteobacteria bacterium]
MLKLKFLINFRVFSINCKAFDVVFSHTDFSTQMILDFPLSQLVQKIKTSDLHPSALVNLVYDQIEKFDQKLNVYRSLVPREMSLKRADQIAQKISNGERVGKLAGLPVAIKDNLSIADPDLTTGCSSRILESYHS